MTTLTISQLSDDELIQATARAAIDERRATVELIRLLLEIDSRRLYLSRGYPSMFAYCTRALGLSEQAAYSRITAARSGRRVPDLLAELEAGGLTLSSIGLLAPHLDDENCDALIEAARGKSTREVERMIAEIHPQPDIAATVRALPRAPVASTPLDIMEDSQADGLLFREAPTVAKGTSPIPTVAIGRVGPRPVVAPLAPRRYLLKVTVSDATQNKLDRLRTLMRHSVPDGDPAEIIDRALTVLLDQVERQKYAATLRPRPEKAISSRPLVPSGRSVPARVRRAVWTRDRGRCAFVGADGPCGETAFLEFHHVVPFAMGGPATKDNIELRCRAHNAYEARLVFTSAQPQPDAVPR